MSTNITGSYPLIYKEPPTLKLALCYNPFLPNDLEKHLLAYDQRKTLADYMEGLPEEVEWLVAYNGEPVDRADWATVHPKPDSIITIVRSPEAGGQNGGKQILRMVAMIAVIAIAAWIAPYATPYLMAMGMSEAVATAVVVATVTTVGSLLVNALIPLQPINPNKGPESTSYGIDGPKNTAREGVPVPVTYGAFRVGGNITDCFTRNVGDDQYLFMRTVLNDGPVEDISDIRVNDQEIWSYKDVEYRVNLGNDGDQPVSWFHEAVRLNQVQKKITQDGANYITKGDCDRVRVDVAFPAGLIEISGNSGIHYDGHVTLNIEYRPMNADGTAPTGPWAPMPLGMELPLDTSGGSGTYTLTGTSHASFSLTPTLAQGETDWTMIAEYRPAGTTGAWTQLSTKTGELGQASEMAAGFGLISSNYVPQVQWDLSFPSVGNWEVRFVGGAIQDNNPYLNTSYQNIPGTMNSLYIKRKTQNPFRLTYESTTLPRGVYEVRVSRLEVENQDPNKPSQCWITDVGEIDNENVSYAGTAMLSLKIKLTDQLNSQPTVTALVKGSILKIYDEDGNVTDERWSDNPADIVLDMLLNPIRGAGEDPTKVIYSKFAEWRETCELENWKFNSVFDFVTTFWDGVQSVARVGHATLIPQGTRYSLAIDKATEPSMLFTGSNMYMDTFNKVWTNLDERANEVQQQFFDADDHYKQKTLRLPDMLAQSRGDKVRPASNSGFGIATAEQATREAEYQARHNSYTTNHITFDAPIEAIGLSIGDVALIQHDSIKYAEGVGGRLESGSTETVIQLDRPVTMTEGNTYALMVVTDALKLFDVTVSAVNGNKVTVLGLPVTNLPRIRRFLQGSLDREVTKVVSLGDGTYVLTLEDAQGYKVGVAECWDTDIIVERPVVFAAGEHTSVTLTAPLPAAPTQYSGFLFGRAVSVKMPYRLNGISGDDDLYRRTLNFTNYDERIYQPGSWGVPTISGTAPKTVGQVQTLHAAWDTHPAPDQQRIRVTLDWNRPANLLNYGGADIYLQQTDGSWRTATTVQEVSTWQQDWNRGDSLLFKVVAFDTTGNRAPFDTAPTVAVDLAVYDIILAPPETLEYGVPVWAVDATADVTWGPGHVLDASGAPSAVEQEVDDYRVDYLPISDADFDALVANNASSLPADIAGDGMEGAWTLVSKTPQTKTSVQHLTVGKFVVRVRGEKGFAASPWVYLAVEVAAPEFGVVVSGLKLNNGTDGNFNTPDAHFAWDDIIAQATAANQATSLPFYWQDYRIRILDANGAVLRTEYIASPTYDYTLAKNKQDGTHRDFKIEVRVRGKQGQLSAPVVMAAHNPPPALPSGVTANMDADAIRTTWEACNDADYGGTLVWLGQSDQFAPADDLIVFDGQSSEARTPLSATGDYYVRVAHYDGFGKTGLNISNAFLVSAPSLIVKALTDASQEGIDVLGQIGLLGDFQGQIDDMALSTLNVALKTIKDRSELAKLTMVDGMDVPTVVSRTTAQFSDQISSEAQERTLLAAKVNDNYAVFLDQVDVQAGINDAHASDIQVLQVTAGGANAAIAAERDARIADGVATASRIDTVVSQVGSVSAAVTQEAKTRADAISAEADLRSALGVRVGNNEGAITQEQTTRASQTGALATTLSKLGALTPDGSAFVISGSTAKMENGQGLAQTIDGLGVRLSGVDGPQGSIATMKSVDIPNAQSAAARYTDTVFAKVGDTYASITSVSQVRTDLSGQITALYTLAVNVNGQVTGFSVNGVTHSFSVVADNFTIVASNGSAVNPFVYNASTGTLDLYNIRLTGSISINGRFSVDSAGNITIRGASGGARLEMDSNQLRVYDGNGTLRVRLGVW